MRIQTTAGVITAQEQVNSPTDAYVAGSTQALQAMIDGIEMSGGGDLPPINDNVSGYYVSKKQLAIWVQFEILNFLTYTDADEALGDTVATEDGIATP